ncbi:hypothetical protein M433DRAFT_7498 [Acidomyces richmondensis BFW]|nr:MAG: hypothetical protein FE78DRAFT_256281 [Acidomyces sp. 'richmondensis']KYG42009.1 hypothetical protein M433DRAFT_7498 [Acidomyces richmondensis BFW]
MTVNGQDRIPDDRQGGPQPRGLFSRFRRSTNLPSSLPTVPSRRTYTPRYAHRDALRSVPPSSERQGRLRFGHGQFDFWLAQTSVHPNFWRSRMMMDGSSRSSQSVPTLASIAEQDERTPHEARRQMTEGLTTMPPSSDGLLYHHGAAWHCNVRQSACQSFPGPDSDTSTDISNDVYCSSSSAASTVSQTHESSSGEVSDSIEKVTKGNHKR